MDWFSNSGDSGNDFEQVEDDAGLASEAKDSNYLKEDDDDKLNDGDECEYKEDKDRRDEEPLQEENKQSKLQRINYLSRYVPYREQLEKTRIDLWQRLKDNLCESLLRQADVLQE